MKIKNNKVLHKSKPTIWYYLLALTFPILFFMVDDSKQLIFDPWEKSLSTYILNSLGLFMFFGIPILLFVLRREITIYPDRVVIIKPTFKISKTYYFSELVKWKISDLYINNVGRQVNLMIKFKTKQLTFNKMELDGFSKLVHILEVNYKDKKR